MIQKKSTLQIVILFFSSSYRVVNEGRSLIHIVKMLCDRHYWHICGPSSLWSYNPQRRWLWDNVYDCGSGTILLRRVQRHCSCGLWGKLHLPRFTQNKVGNTSNTTLVKIRTERQLISLTYKKTVVPIRQLQWLFQLI